MLSQIIQRSWYRSFSIVTLLLLPLSVLFCALVSVRRVLYRAGIFSQTKLPVPVIVVGNISVGGTGKTPLVIAITNYLKTAGYSPGVISRGYGGQSDHWPLSVTAESSPLQAGDEAVLLAKHCNCPVSVGPNRVEAAEALLANHDCNIVVSDDGLQHLAMQRDIEIIVIDGERRFGNGLCLPAGPLRELAERVNQANIVVSNGHARANEEEMQLTGELFHSLSETGETLPTTDFEGQTVHAVAGIGNNERFFRVLENMDINVIRHSFPDHYVYNAKDIEFADGLPVLMTEKDAVKCRQFPPGNKWYLKVNATLNEKFYVKLKEILDGLNQKAGDDNG